MRFFAFGFRGIAVCLLVLCALLVSGNVALAQSYTNDTNIAHFTANIGSYATLTNFNNSDGNVTSPFTPTSTELATTQFRVYNFPPFTPITGLPATSNWLLATFSSPVSTIVVFPNIDHFGSNYDGYQYTIQGSNDGATWTPLFDALTVNGSVEPFTLGSFSGTAPSTVNNVLTPGSAPGSFGTVGYIATFNFRTPYKYYAFGTSSVATTNTEQELSAVGAPAPTGETIFISTFSGRQIVKVVDGAPPATASAINTDTVEEPEDLVVGPDGNIYVCDADQDRIRRLTNTGEGFAVDIVYDRITCHSEFCPSGPEGPSFDTLGNLFFNTRGPGHTGVWKIPASQLSPIPSGGATPVNVVTAAATGSTFGEGTTFDANDKLLFVDRSGGKVWRFDPVTSTLSAIITGLSTPFGIAVDSAGDIFVSNHDTHQVLRYLSDGTPQGPYVTFASNCVECPVDSPAYLQFDASDRLYVVTNQNSLGQFGKVWRADPIGTPPMTGTQTLLVDLNAREFASSGAVVGLGLPATTFTTAQQAISPGSTTTFTDGTILKTMLKLPVDVILNGAAFMAVSFIQIAPGVFDTTRLPATSTNTWSGGTPVAPGATLTPLKGAGGNGIVAEKLCFNANHAPIKPCNIIAPTTLIQLSSRYDTQSPQPNPGLILGTDGQNDWADITSGFTTDCCGISGGSKGLNTDEAIVNLAPITDTSSIIRLIREYLDAGCIVVDNDDHEKGEEDRVGAAMALINKLSEAQEAINAGQIRKAINILTAVKRQIQRQSGKHILTSCTILGVPFNPVTVLLTDVQILIDHLRLSVTPNPITGYVVDSNGLGISGATVSIKDSSLHTVETATSDITGFYFFPSTDDLVSGANYTAQVTGFPSGFTKSTPTSQPFKWLGSGIVLSNFALTP
jgi:hypothetical protein